MREPVHDAWRRARDVAKDIKEAVRAATGLSCSIGIAPNKLLAKIASELDKPDGLTLLTAADIPARIWPLPTRKVNGIGPKSSAKLEALGDPHDRRTGAGRSGVAGRALRQQLRRVAACGRATGATSGRW